MDVYKEGSIPYIVITDDGDDQSVKNHISRCSIPLHAQLVRRGFLDFVAAQRDAGETRLFPEIVADAH